MNEPPRSSSSSPANNRPRFWQNSLYEEPFWVSLAWIVGPLAAAGAAIYFALG
jgi:hypothetical protein